VISSLFLFLLLFLASVNTSSETDPNPTASRVVDFCVNEAKVAFLCGKPGRLLKGAPNRAPSAGGHFQRAQTT
jgi:hypothetical protein